MTDREKLIELKIQFVENFDCGYCKPEESKCKKCLTEKEADYLLANDVIVPPKWISVNDKLPNKDGDYLCCWKVSYSDKPFISIYSFAKNLRKVDKYDFKGKNRAGWYDYDSEWGYCEQGCVTHWMPLPELPKESEGK